MRNTPIPAVTVARASCGELAARLVLAALVVLALLFVVANAWSRTPLSVLRALDSLPVYKHDRGPEQAELKAAQLQSVSAAITEAAQGDRDLAALLVTVGYHESAWSMAIGAGHCERHQCDRDRKGNVRAVSNYQLWRVSTSSPEAWELAKTDVRVASREAARALKRAWDVQRRAGHAAGDASSVRRSWMSREAEGRRGAGGDLAQSAREHAVKVAIPLMFLSAIVGAPLFAYSDTWATMLGGFACHVVYVGTVIWIYRTIRVKPTQVKR
jgi:hypothetical protein